MKNLLYILLTLSILSGGCSKEDDVQITQEAPNNLILDENLFGNWKLIEYTPPNIDYFRSFSSNGRWGYWVEQYSWDGNDYTIFEYNYNIETGDWWVEEDILFLNYDDSPADEIFQYSVIEDTLYLYQESWSKQ